MTVITDPSSGMVTATLSVINELSGGTRSRADSTDAIMRWVAKSGTGMSKESYLRLMQKWSPEFFTRSTNASMTSQILENGANFTSKRGNFTLKFTSARVKFRGKFAVGFPGAISWRDLSAAPAFE